MQSIVSSAKPKMNAIIKENLHRFWPIAFVYFLILFMVTVFIAILDTSEANGFDIIWNTINNGRLVIPVITSAASLTFAVCIFGFLHNTGQASVTHALPFSRKALFSAHFISGFILSIAPFILLAFSMLPFCFGANAHNPDAYLRVLTPSQILATLGMWLLSNGIIILCTYALCVFAGIITGTVIMHILVAGLLNLFIPFFYKLITIYLSSFLLGYPTNTSSINTILSYMHPALYNIFHHRLGILAAIVYIGISAIIILFALILYRVLKLERAGDSTTFHVAEKILTYIVTLLGMAAFGLAFTIPTPFTGNGAMPPFYIISAIGAIITFIIVQMIMKKTPKIFNQATCKTFGIYVIVGILFLVCTTSDITGYSNRVPSPNHVKSVIINSDIYPFMIPYNQEMYGEQLKFTKKDDIANVTNLHRHLITANKEAIQDMQNAADNLNTIEDPYDIPKEGIDENLTLYNTIISSQLNFHYKTGSPFGMQRNYQYESADPILKLLADTDEFKKTYRLANTVGYDKIDSVTALHANTIFYSVNPNDDPGIE
ncbi:MAG: hypothetical protein LBN22_00965 [Clostridiales Family XIII bacterium]|jgi:ABC-2 type transport system permease protein|nr:hypothetical protein [Clostridiales Family XIII bacterium]